jgi:hypothetical protein
MTTKTLTLLLSISTACVAGTTTSRAESGGEGSQIASQGQAEVVSGREARARARAAAGGEVAVEKVEVYTKPGGEKFDSVEVIEILKDSAEEYGVIWKDGTAPAADAAADKLAAMLGTTREELNGVAKEVSKSAAAVAGDMKYVIDSTKENGEIHAMAKDISKAAAETADDLNYAIEATKNSGEVRAMAQDLGQAAGETAGDIQYALNHAKENGGVVGAVAGVLGVSAEELKDVIQVFGKEAKAIYKDLASLPEWGELGQNVSGAAGGVSNLWVSEGGELVAALGSDETRVVVGQASAKGSGEGRKARQQKLDAVSPEAKSEDKPSESNGQTSGDQASSGLSQ